MSTGSPYTYVGMPWEIFRTQNLTPKHPHTIDIYGKGGGATGYRSQATVIDEYGVSIVLLTAGSAKAANFIHNAVLEILIPAVDDIAREQVEKYTGTFLSRPANTTAGLKVAVAQDVNSILLEGIEKNGTDILQAYRQLFVMNVGEVMDTIPTVARIFPTDIQKNATIRDCSGRDKAVIKEEWRLDWDVIVNTASALPGASIVAGDCINWVTSDFTHYASESMDRIVFIKDLSTGEVLGIELPILRSGLIKKTK
jgi:hypothetical protein